MHQNILRHTHLFISIYRSLFLATTFDDAGRILECTGAFQLADSDFRSFENAAFEYLYSFRRKGRGYSKAAFSNDRKLELANCRASVHSRIRPASSKVVAKNKLR